MKKMVLKILVVLARVRIRRLKPFVIGITGSVGKTSTKEAIYSILQTRYKVLKSEKSYNTEFGLPLTILEQKSGFSSALKWMKVLISGAWKAFFAGHSFQIMVLEMAVDKPGDMDFLLKVVRPQVGVMTNIKSVHLGEGHFKDVDDIFLDKSKLVFSLPKNGTAILNVDDPYILSLKDKLDCKKILYGFSELADLKVLNLTSGSEGIQFTLKYGDEIVEDSLTLFGKFQIYIVLSAVATALIQGFNLKDAVEALKAYKSPAGRMNLIAGINGSKIIDSTYNASPETVKNAVQFLSEISLGRKIAVLGDMNELGDLTEKYHREIGEYVHGKVDILITIGKNAKLIYDEAKKYGFNKELLSHFENSLEAGEFLKNILKNEDNILVKGSQNNVRLERLVKELMLNPGDAKSLLVRQEEEWMKS